MFLHMPIPIFTPPRIRVVSLDPFTAPEPSPPPRPRGTRRPHTNGKVAQVRHLVEQTRYTYAEIARRTGVAPASICRWAQAGAWARPAFAPRATDTVPRWRASAKLKRRTLSARLTALAERHIRELEESACVDAQKLGEALELLRMAKVAGQGRRRRKPGALDALHEPMRPIIELCAADVDLHRAPREALDDFLENRAPPPKEEKRSRRGWRRKRDRFNSEEYHRWMRKKEGS
jgi:transposase-like protein